MNTTIQPLVDSLRDQARLHPEQAAFLGEQGPITYGVFARMVAAAAARLGKAGLADGERVLLCGPNSPAWAAAYFAVHAAGCVAVPVDADMPRESIRWVAEDSEAHFALAARDLSLAVPTALFSECGAAEPPKGDTTKQPPEDDVIKPRLDAAADLLYTSGTTGRKKGVLLTHRQVAQAATNINAFLGTRAGDLELVPVPLSHSFGLGRLRCLAQAGHTLALEAGMRNAAKVLKHALDFRVTGLALVPAGVAMILRMTKDRLGDAREHLRYLEIGSAALDVRLKHELMRLLPRTRICHHYGLTEASRAAFLEYHTDRHKLVSIGRPSPNVEIAVRTEHGRTAAPGEHGEILVRGGMVMKEYWKQPELTSEILRDGWLRTGDWGYRDEEGYLYLVGRRTDLVNVGGMKVSPEEVEQALNAHPSIVESACAGVPDPFGIAGECVQAFLVTRAEVTDEQLVEWLRGTLEEYKIPRIWQRVECLPKTTSGKIQRHLLQE